MAKKKEEYIRCKKCGCQDFSNRICFRLDHKNESVIVQQRGYGNCICDKCGESYEFYNLISYPRKRKKK